MKKSSGKRMPIETYALSDIIEGAEDRRKRELGYYTLPEVDGFSYPTFFTASFDYFATGEGQTIGVVMGYAQSEEAIKSTIAEHFGSYFASGADIWPKLHLPPDLEALIPAAIRKVIAEPSLVLGNFRYSSTYHLNQS